MFADVIPLAVGEASKGVSRVRDRQRMITYCVWFYEEGKQLTDEESKLKELT